MLTYGGIRDIDACAMIDKCKHVWRSMMVHDGIHNMTSIGHSSSGSLGVPGGTFRILVIMLSIIPFNSLICPLLRSDSSPLYISIGSILDYVLIQMDSISMFLKIVFPASASILWYIASGFLLFVWVILHNVVDVLYKS